MENNRGNRTHERKKKDSMIVGINKNLHKLAGKVNKVGNREGEIGSIGNGSTRVVSTKGEGDHKAPPSWI